MQTVLRHNPVFSVATITLDPNEAVVAESGAMMSMSIDMTVETAARGGFLKSLARSALGGESFFMNTFTAGPSGGQIQFVTKLPGDIDTIALDGSSTWMVQSGSFLASNPTVEVDTKWGGAKSFFAGEGLVLLRCSGQGDLLVSTYGAIDRFHLAEGYALTVDSGHIVAFEESIRYETRQVGGLKATLLSGEGLVVDIHGPGEVLLQTRSLVGLEDWVRSLIPTQTN